MPTSNSRGFTLVEAMVALVVLALVFSAVWGWFGSAVSATDKIQRAMGLPEVFVQFRQHIELEDLQQQRSGTYQIGDYSVAWQATVARQSDQEPIRRQPAWIVALFDVSASISRNGAPVSEFSTQVIKQWRDPNYFEMPDF